MTVLLHQLIVLTEVCLYSILQQELSPHDILEPNHCSEIATIAKEVKLHHTKQKQENNFQQSIRCLGANKM